MKLEPQRFVAGKLILKHCLLLKHFLLLPEPGYVYGRDLRVVAMKFEISGLTVLPQPPLDGSDKKH